MGAIRRASDVSATRRIQRFEGWHIVVRTTPRAVMLPTTGIMVPSEGVVDISEDVLDRGPNVKVVREVPTTRIAIIILVVVIHSRGERDGGGQRTRGVCNQWAICVSCCRVRRALGDAYLSRSRKHQNVRHCSRAVACSVHDNSIY